MPNDWNAELNSVTMINHALAYAKKGWPVFPVWWPIDTHVCACGERDNCASIGKHPITKNGHTNATTDADQITQWWEQYPSANIGLATGKQSGVSVLDIDQKHYGFQSFQQLLRRYGPPKNPTLTVATGGGGAHFYWEYNKKHRCKQNIRTGIDVRSTGGYVLVPPSLHEQRCRYRWAPKGHPRNVTASTPPDWVERLLQGLGANGNRRSSAPLAEPNKPIPDGERNGTLFRYACKFQHDGLDDGDIEDRTFELNEKYCEPPLPPAEVNKIVGSALRYKKGE